MTLRKKFHRNGHLVCSILNYTFSYIALLQRGQMANCCCLKYSVSISRNYSSEGCLKCFKSTKGHLQAPKTLTFKMRRRAQPFLWKWVLFAGKWKIISISRAQHLTLFWYRRPGEFRNVLLVSALSWSSLLLLLLLFFNWPVIIFIMHFIFLFRKSTVFPIQQLIHWKIRKAF